MQALRRLLATRRIDAGRAEGAVRRLDRVAVYRYPHGPLLPRIWELRHNLSAYDAAYVALAEALDTRVLTYDARLAAAPGVEGRVELLQ